jgi:hypothetical protein
MTKTGDDRDGVSPPRDENREHVLLAGGREKMTLSQFEKRCLASMTKLVAETAIWPLDGYRTAWRIGDFNILIVQTTVAPKAEFYVQFWSEPNGPVDWEVSSGHLNPALLKFIGKRARTRLGEMGFAVGGGAGNFGKSVSVANGGDAAAVARDVLRVFHDALGYRGATPLVARVIRGSRCGRAVVHTKLTLHDTTTLLQQMGYDTKIFRKGRRPVVGGRLQGFQFAVALDVPAPHAGEFHCLDFVTSVGRITDGSHAAWGEALNRLNGLSRVARGWIDDTGNICVGASLSLMNGMTEDEIGHTIASWHRAAAELLGGPQKPKGGKRKKPGESDDDPLRGDEDDEPQARPVVH